jgi:hypothetical protein
VGRVGFEPTQAFSRRIYSPLLLATQAPPHIGAGDPTRTDDLLITSQLLYQLSYTGNSAACATINIAKDVGDVKDGRKISPPAGVFHQNHKLYLHRCPQGQLFDSHGGTDMLPLLPKESMKEFRSPVQYL